MPECVNHPERQDIYWDALHKVHLCFQCISEYIGTHRGDHLLKREEPPRLTCEVPAYKMYVGNYEAGCIKSFAHEEILGIPVDVVINVSDSHSPAADYWFPINEVAPWSYAPFYWFKKIADRCFSEGLSVLVHCHAGIHRSKMMVFCWLLSIGYRPADAAFEMAQPDMKHDYEYDIMHGIIPDNLPFFYATMAENPGYSLMGVLKGLDNDFALMNNHSQKHQYCYRCRRHRPALDHNCEGI